MTSIQQWEDDFSLPLFAKRGITLVRGKNASLWDDNGNEYIDCMAGQGVANIGHCNEAVAEAISKQSRELMICTGSFYNDMRARLMKKLVEIAPINLKKVFLCSSGAESIEAAIKFARVSTSKTEIICAMRGFHGRTFGALSATFNKKYRQPFEPLVPGFKFVPFNNIEKIEKSITEKTAAIMLEPVQGEGGVYPGDPQYFKAVSDLCDQHDILFIIDEIQSGLCRTGSFFAHEDFDIEPDMMCLAKSIAGGIPMGVVLCSDKIKLELGQHGTTFGGNPLACAAALASIEFMMNNNLADQAREKGAYFSEKFQAADYTQIREIRQQGLMIGIELKEKVKPYINQLQQRGILALPAGPTVLRLLPPLTIEYEQLDRVIIALKDIFTQPHENE